MKLKNKKIDKYTKNSIIDSTFDSIIKVNNILKVIDRRRTKKILFGLKIIITP